MAFTDRNEKMQNAWKKTPKADKFTAPPDGKYQAVIKKATLGVGTRGKLTGAKMVTFELSIVTGEYKNRKVWRSINLDAKKKGDDGVTTYFGIAQFKADMDTLEIEIPEVYSDKGIVNCLKDAVDSVVDIQVKQNSQGYTQVYINRLVNSSDTNDEDTEEEEIISGSSEEEETTESEAESSEEESEEEEEEEKPVVKKKKKSQDEAALESARKLAKSMGIDVPEKKKPKPQEKKEEETEDWQSAFDE